MKTVRTGFCLLCSVRKSEWGSEWNEHLLMSTMCQIIHNKYIVSFSHQLCEVDIISTLKMRKQS